MEKEGGVFCGYVLEEWIRAYTWAGCLAVPSGGRVRVGHAHGHVYTPSPATGIVAFKRFASTSSTLALACSNSFMCPDSSRFN